MKLSTQESDEIQEVTKIYAELKDLDPNTLLCEKFHIKNPYDLHVLFQGIKTRVNFLFWVYNLNFKDHEEEMFSLLQEIFKYIKNFRQYFYDPSFCENTDTETMFQLIQDKMNLAKEYDEYLKDFKAWYYYPLFF